jgi:hypothetical protein
VCVCVREREREREVRSVRESVSLGAVYAYVVLYSTTGR